MSPAHARLCRNLFVDADVGALRGACALAQQRGCPGDQVIGRQRGAQVVALDAALVVAFEMQCVAPVDQHEHRLQQVVAVGAPTGHMQEQVEFGRGRNVEQGFHAVIMGKPRQASSKIQQDAQYGAWGRCDAARCDAALIAGAQVDLPARVRGRAALDPVEQGLYR